MRRCGRCQRVEELPERESDEYCNLLSRIEATADRKELFDVVNCTRVLAALGQAHQLLLDGYNADDGALYPCVARVLTFDQLSAIYNRLWMTCKMSTSSRRFE